jgi:hypothetical protein
LVHALKLARRIASEKQIVEEILIYVDPNRGTGQCKLARKGSG